MYDLRHIEADVAVGGPVGLLGRAVHTHAEEVLAAEEVLCPVGPEGTAAVAHASVEDGEPAHRPVGLVDVRESNF